MSETAPPDLAGAELGARVDAQVNTFAVEDAAIAAARVRAGEVGLVPVAPSTGAALRFLAGVTGARAIAELGTGTGVSGLWLLAGMRPDGLLTSVDHEPEHQRLARSSFSEGGGAGRTRLIGGRAQEVLPRLADGAYDLVHVDLPLPDAVDLLAEALRVLRPGGVLAVSRALAGGRAGEVGARDPAAIAARTLLAAVGADERLTAVVLPTGDGLLAAVRV